MRMIKIKKASNVDGMWYNDKIDHVFWSGKKYDYLDYYITTHGAVFYEDASEVNLSFRDKILWLLGKKKFK